jgi:hypothetical protein
MIRTLEHRTHTAKNVWKRCLFVSICLLTVLVFTTICGCGGSDSVGTPTMTVSAMTPTHVRRGRCAKDLLSELHAGDGDGARKFIGWRSRRRR